MESRSANTRAGSASLVPKEFSSHQMRGNGSTIDGYECAFSLAFFVEEARGDFFSGAGLGENEDRLITLRNTLQIIR